MKTITIEKYMDVDWEKQDVVLAREMGLSRERIRQVRRELGRPNSPLHCAMTGVRGATTAGLREIMGWSGKVTVEQVCRTVFNRKPTEANLAALRSSCSRV